MCRVCDCAGHLAMHRLAFGWLFCFVSVFEVCPLSVLMGSLLACGVPNLSRSFSNWAGTCFCCRFLALILLLALHALFPAGQLFSVFGAACITHLLGLFVESSLILLRAGDRLAQVMPILTALLRPARRPAGCLRTRLLG